MSFQVMRVAGLLLLASAAAAAGKAPETTAAACSDGVDNDDNGLADCDDPSCEELVFCRRAVRRPENTAAACQDGIDNDGDGAVDCANPKCQVFNACAGGYGGQPSAGLAVRRASAPAASSGFRWGASAHPGAVMLLGSGVAGASAGVGGVGISLRLGYQFSERAGLVAEPYFSFMGQDNAVLISMVGSLLLQIHLTRVSIGFGPSVGGFALCSVSPSSCATVRGVAGGFVLRLTLDAWQRQGQSGHGTSAATVGLELRPLIYNNKDVSGAGQAGAALGLAMTLGWDAY